MDHSDLVDIFAMTVPILELVVRGTLMYWFLVLVFRLILRRDVGSMGLTDFLFVVLLGDAAQNGMIGEATSATDAITLIATLVCWNVLIDWASYRFPAVERVLVAHQAQSRRGEDAFDRATCGASSSRSTNSCPRCGRRGWRT